ncbi:ABC transporter ATP-binding protein [Cellulomonas sp. APG4]|uniref:ABC transporter ATP-binding protein n=1 Tax=Cellulomonas sp. APG4 TaxID=1538656 RepID=UPI00137954A8|nr:ABC transporter ATP-binding protein [Cellulomonas sp. APG4]NCT91008.1 ABC transporter ATP-binding protein [Cellulomonas sp. APG4]
MTLLDEAQRRTAPSAEPPVTGPDAAHLVCSGLRFRYPGAADDALRGIDVDAAPGTITALVGPSGCGKTTLLKLVGGLLRPTAGQIAVDGADTTDLPLTRRKVGWVPQQYALFEHLDVTGNVAFGLRAQKVPAAERAERVGRMLELCRISELARRPVADLSGGQRQRVAIARALAPFPRILLLDEPLAALDPQLRVQLRSELAALIREAGVTTLLVTHDQEEALAVADQLVLLRDGGVVQAGPSARLWEQPADAWAAGFLGHAVTVPGVVVPDGGARLAPGLVVGLRTPADDGARATAGDEVLVALRSGDLHADAAGDAPSGEVVAAAREGAAGRVETVEFAGERYRLQVRLEAGPAVPAHALAPLTVGQRVTVAAVAGRSVAVVGR